MRKAGGRGGGEPRGQPEPLDFSPDGWTGHPRGPPLIDLGGKTEPGFALGRGEQPAVPAQTCMAARLLHPHFCPFIPLSGYLGRPQGGDMNVSLLI